ncbi:MAG: hypothetical protein IPI34_06945 [bacterium]|nr:hypothetical protein [bacterium]
MQHRHVLRAQRRQGGRQDRQGVGEGDLLLRGRGHRHVQVVQAQVLEAEGLAAQFHVAVQGREVGVHRRDQVVVDGDRQAVLVQVRLERGVVAAGARVHHVQLALAAQRGGEDVLELPQRGQERPDGLGAHRAVGREPEAGVVRQRQLHLLALGVVDDGPGDVRQQRLEGLLHAAGDLVEVDLGPQVVARELQDALRLRAEHAVAPPSQVVQVAAVRGRPVLGGVGLLQGRRVQGQGLGPDETGSRGQLVQQGQTALRAGLGRLVGQLRVQRQVGVLLHVADAVVEREVERQAVAQGLRVLQAPPEGGQAADLPLQPRARGFPGLRRREQRRQVPLVDVGHLRPRGVGVRGVGRQIGGGRRRGEQGTSDQHDRGTITGHRQHERLLDRADRRKSPIASFTGQPIIARSCGQGICSRPRV